MSSNCCCRKNHLCTLKDEISQFFRIAAHHLVRLQVQGHYAHCNHLKDNLAVHAHTDKNWLWLQTARKTENCSSPSFSPSAVFLIEFPTPRGRRHSNRSPPFADRALLRSWPKDFRHQPGHIPRQNQELGITTTGLLGRY